MAQDNGIDQPSAAQIRLIAGGLARMGESLIADGILPPTLWYFKSTQELAEKIENAITVFVTHVGKDS